VNLDRFIETRLKKEQRNKKLARNVRNAPINYKAIYKTPVEKDGVNAAIYETAES
jgi:hypothetical protein